MENISNISSEDELLQLRNDGKISEAEYQELLAAIRKSPAKDTKEAVSAGKFINLQDVPWQIWFVVALLALEGIGNLLSIPQQPMALLWLGAKCLFILGLLKRWRWVFCLYVIIGLMHILYFLLQAPIVTLINLAMVVLVLSSYRFYFPTQVENNDLLGSTKKQPAMGADVPTLQSSIQDSKHKQGKIAFYLMLAGIVLPIVGFFVCFAISGGGDGDVIFSVCLFLFVLIEIPAFALGVIGWPDNYGKATVITILTTVTLVAFLISLSWISTIKKERLLRDVEMKRAEIVRQIETLKKATMEAAAVTELEAFALDDLHGLITQSGISIDKAISSDGNGSLRIDATEPTTIRLFETGDIDIENARLIYKAKVRTGNVQGHAYLEMWCHFPGKGEFFTKGLTTPLTGTTNWTNLETPFLLKEGENPDNIKLNLVITDKGTVWIDDVRLLKGTLP